MALEEKIAGERGLYSMKIEISRGNEPKAVLGYGKVS